MKLFVFEWISAGGLGPQAPAELRAEGWLMLAALADDFKRVPGVEILTVVESDCPRGLERKCRRIDSVEVHVAFEETVGQADVVLVIAPEFDDILANLSRCVLDAGKTLLGPTLNAIRLATDKLALGWHLSKHSIPTPPSILLPRGAQAEGQAAHLFPTVCKPRFGAGSQATFLIRTESAFDHCWTEARSLEPSTQFLLQPFVHGQPASVTLMIGPNQCLALEPTAQRLSDDGRFHYLGGWLPLAESPARRARALALRAVSTVEGLAGLVGVDLVLGEAADGSADYVMEINPRPTTSYIGLRQLAMDNLAEALLRVMRGEVVAPIRWRQERVVFSSKAIGL